MGANESIARAIKDAVRSVDPGAEVVLFGSRARGLPAGLGLGLETPPSLLLFNKRRWLADTPAVRRVPRSGFAAPGLVRRLKHTLPPYKNNSSYSLPPSFFFRSSRGSGSGGGGSSRSISSVVTSS